MPSVCKTVCKTISWQCSGYILYLLMNILLTILISLLIALYNITVIKIFTDKQINNTLKVSSIVWRNKVSMQQVVCCSNTILL